MTNQAVTPGSAKDYLEKYIIGQSEAIDAVSVAIFLKDRLDHIKDPVKKKNARPSNMLLTGSTGVGKTEIARRIAEYLDAPFVNFPVTRLSERGYVGGKVEDVLAAVMGASVRHVKSKLESSEKARERADMDVSELLGLDKGCDKSKIEILVIESVQRQTQMFGGCNVKSELPPGFPLMPMQIESSVKFLGYDEIVKSKVLEKAVEDRSSQELNSAVIDEANRAIVFLDEIDKLCEASNGKGMVSRQGVQYELLTLIEGATYDLPQGQLSTDRMLFIAAGAFSDSKPDDLIPELLGRLPVRVYLNPLNNADVYKKILNTDFSVTNQQKWMLEGEFKDFDFTDDAKSAIAEYAFRMNKADTDSGARVLDRIVQAVMRHYLLVEKAKGPVTKDMVDLVIKGSIEKLEKSYGSSDKKVGFVKF